MVFPLGVCCIPNRTFFLFPNHWKLNLSSNNTMLELKALNIAIPWFKSRHTEFFISFLSPFYCQRSLLPSKGYKFHFSSFLLFALTFKLLAIIFLKLFLLNSRIRYIDTCAGYNGRGTFSNELLDFVQDLAKDLFRFSSRLNSFIRFSARKKPRCFKNCLSELGHTPTIQKWIDRRVHEYYSEWESQYDF